jgi:hypothetical protein
MLDQLQSSLELAAAAFKFARETQKEFGSHHVFTKKALDNAIEAMKQSNEILDEIVNQKLYTVDFFTAE